MSKDELEAWRLALIRKIYGMMTNPLTGLIWEIDQYYEALKDSKPKSNLEKK